MVPRLRSSGGWRDASRSVPAKTARSMPRRSMKQAATSPARRRPATGSSACWARSRRAREAKPEWIALRGECRLERLSARGPRGAAAAPPSARCCAASARPAPDGLGRKRRLALWRAVASRGFHDFSDEGWTKSWDSPFVESYDYVGAYLAGGLAALDPFARLLGRARHPRLRRRTTSSPPSSAAASAPSSSRWPAARTSSTTGHFRHPDLRYLMFDLDPKARDFVAARPLARRRRLALLARRTCSTSGCGSACGASRRAARSPTSASRATTTSTRRSCCASSTSGRATSTSSCSRSRSRPS